VKLTPADAAALYRSGIPACRIAQAHGITRPARLAAALSSWSAPWPRRCRT
jgi:hypothetical protein